MGSRCLGGVVIAVGVGAMECRVVVQVIFEFKQRWVVGQFYIESARIVELWVEAYIGYAKAVACSVWASFRIMEVCKGG